MRRLNAQINTKTRQERTQLHDDIMDDAATDGFASDVQESCSKFTVGYRRPTEPQCRAKLTAAVNRRAVSTRLKRVVRKGGEVGSTNGKRADDVP